MDGSEIRRLCPFPYTLVGINTGGLPGEGVSSQENGKQEWAVIDLYNLLTPDRPELFLGGPGLHMQC